MLDAIKQRLEQLGGEIEEYREIQKVEREKKALELVLHMGKIELNQREIEKLRGEKRLKVMEREKILSRRESMMELDSSVSA